MRRATRWQARCLAMILLGTVALSLPVSQGEGQQDASVTTEAQEPEGRSTLAPAEVEQITEQGSRAEALVIAERDAAILERLGSIFAALERLSRVRFDVQAGIVVLSGQVPTRDDALTASEIARALDGVVLVIDEVAVEKDIAVRLAAAWERVQGQLRSALGLLPLLGLGLVVLLLAWLAARLLRDADFLYRLFSRRTLLQNLLRQTVYVAVLAVGVVLALKLLDAGALIGTALGAAGVVGLGLGFAFRNIVENYLAGILLAIRQPFSIRDLVSVGGTLGTVLRMTSSETTLLDANGNHVRLPNAMVFNGTVVNYTRNPLRRFTVSVGVGTDVDLAYAQQVGVETLDRMNGIVDDPAPWARVAELGDSTVRLELHGWIDQRVTSFERAAAEATRLVKVAFDQAGIGMPAPTYHVRMEGSSAAAQGRDAQRPRAGALPATEVGLPPEEVDVSVLSDTAGQVEAAIAQSGEDNLLLHPDEPSGEPRS